MGSYFCRWISVGYESSFFRKSFKTPPHGQLHLLVNYLNIIFSLAANASRATVLWLSLACIVSATLFFFFFFSLLYWGCGGWIRKSCSSQIFGCNFIFRGRVLGAWCVISIQGSILLMFSSWEPFNGCQWHLIWNVHTEVCGTYFIADPTIRIFYLRVQLVKYGLLIQSSQKLRRMWFWEGLH